jgi:hypothetical protein
VLFKSRASRESTPGDERFVKARRVNPKNFFAELKRRNVYKVAIAYAVVAWLLMQVASQLRLERNLGEAIRLLQARQAQFHFASEIDKGINQVTLAMVQRLAGDTAGAKVTAENSRNTLEPLYRDQPDSFPLAAQMSRAYAAMAEKNLALKEAERAIVLLPSAKDRAVGPGLEENLALIQITFGENSRAISILTQLLQTPYASSLYGTPVTPALLRLDPLWDPLRADPAFQKLCEERQP